MLTSQQQYCHLCIAHYHRLKLEQILSSKASQQYLIFPLLLLSNIGKIFTNRTIMIRTIVNFVITKMYKPQIHAQPIPSNLQQQNPEFNLSEDGDKNLYIHHASQLFIRIFLLFLAEIWQIKQFQDEGTGKQISISKIYQSKLKVLCRLIHSYLAISNAANFSDLLIEFMEKIEKQVLLLVKGKQHLGGVYEKLQKIMRHLMLQKLQKWFDKKQCELKKQWESKNHQVKENIKLNKLILPENNQPKILISKIPVQKPPFQSNKCQESHPTTINYSPPSSSIQHRLSLYKSQRQTRKSCSRTLYHEIKYKFTTNAKYRKDEEFESCLETGEVDEDESNFLPRKL